MLAEVLRAGQAEDRVSISALGLREGLLYSKLSPEEQAEDPLLSAARELSLLRSRSPAHARGADPVDGAGAGGARAGGDGGGEAAARGRLPARRHRLARASGLSRRAEPEHHLATPPSSASTIPAAPIWRSPSITATPGLSDEELGPGIRELAPLRHREGARALAGAFRVAYLVSGAVDGVLPRTSIRRSDGRLELVLPRDLADLSGPRLDSRMRQFAALGGFSSATVVEN